MVPNGITADEADMGYNAYSILKSGRDVYNKSTPLFFRSLNDYKAGIVIYSLVPAIAIFGLNDFAIRLTPAILGAITPVLIYFLIKQLYPKEKYTAYIGAILTLFAPWNIAISRATFIYAEFVFAYLLFLIFFLKGVNKNPKYFILSGIVLGITIYIYYAGIIYLPIILAVLGFIYRKNLAKSKKPIVLGLLILFVIILPAIVLYAQKDTRSRFNAISVFTPDLILPLSISEREQDLQNNDKISALLHNRRFVYTSVLLDNYTDYFNLDYLFVNAKNVRYFYVNYVGLFYLVELPFFLFGLYKLFNLKQKSNLLLLALLVIGPLPAAITLGSAFPHRALLTVLAIQLITALGLGEILKLTFNKRYKNYFYVGGVLSYTLFVFFFLHQYFIHSPNEFIPIDENGTWFAPYRDVIPIINKYQSNYDHIVFSWSGQKSVPGLYYLLYNKIDPKIIQAKAALWTNEPPSYKQLYNQFGNIEFRTINWDHDKSSKNALFVGRPEDFPENLPNVLDKTYSPTGRVNFLLIGTEK